MDYSSLAEDLLATCKAYDYCGHDPFDGLNSSLFRSSGLARSKFMQVAWLQMHKRSPWNLRPLVGVPRSRNPKGIALIILGLIELSRATGRTEHFQEAKRLGHWLLTQRVSHSVSPHAAWGYHFDWAARAFTVMRGTPNAITTCYVARALDELGEALDEPLFRAASVDAGLFLDTLYQEQQGLHYYAYVPGETAFVHNASLWTAALVAKTATRLARPELKQRALDVARLSVSMQRPDGAWLYGTRHHHDFIDGFHTGYNLEALNSIRETLGITEFDEAIDRGLAYYRTTFFMPDGTVKYYHDTPWPLDTHSVAQAVITLVRVGRSKSDAELAGKVIQRALQTLYLPKERRFMYQRGRLLTNRINYLRWTQAWAFYSISMYARNLKDAGQQQ